jgi:4-hydroxy-tetrahydrodipicolinate synthase
MVRAANHGDFVKARKLHEKYHPLFRDLFIETNPIPVKAALAMMGQMEEEYRLPLVPLSQKNRETLKATLTRCGVLSQ